jgi:hypothetical protein
MVAIVRASAAVTCRSNQRNREGLASAREAAARRRYGKEEAAEEAARPSFASRDESPLLLPPLSLACACALVRQRR